MNKKKVKEEAGDDLRYIYASIVVGVKEKDNVDDGWLDVEEGYDWLEEQLNNISWQPPAKRHVIYISPVQMKKKLFEQEEAEQ